MALLQSSGNDQPRMPDFPRLKRYALLAIGVVFTLGGAAMVLAGAQHGWPVLLFFGLCTAVFVDELWPALFRRAPAPPEMLLQRFPGPVELSTDPRRLLFLMVGAAIFGGVTFWVLQHEPFGWFETIVLWLCVVGCAAAIPLMIVLMLQGSSLRLDGEGLQVRHAFRRHFTRWADASVFEVSDGPAPMVIFDDAASRGGTLGAINAGIVGRSGGLPDSYGLSHEELARLLNAWRQRALAVAR
jgi:hypothetical protein